MCLNVFLLGFMLWGTLFTSWTWLTFLSHIGEVFNYNFFKSFLNYFLFFFLLWDPYNSNVGIFNIVPKISEAILNSFHSFPFILLFSSYFHHSIFQFTYPFFASVILLWVSARAFLGFALGGKVWLSGLYWFLLGVPCVCVLEGGNQADNYRNNRTYTHTSLMVQSVKTPPAVWETWVRSPGREDTLE